MTVQNLKNLKFLYTSDWKFNYSFLASLKQLEEIHLGSSDDVKMIFEAKQQHGRSDLKIYLQGLLLNGLNEPAISSLCFSSKKKIITLAKNRSRLANEIPFKHLLNYSEIEHIAPEVEINVLSRFTDFDRIQVDKQVKDIERFLDFLKNFSNIVDLHFSCALPHDLFDRMPDYCAVQKLNFVYCLPPDFGFLSRLPKLIHLALSSCPIDPESVRKCLEAPNFLAMLLFKTTNRNVKIQIGYPKCFKLTFGTQMMVASHVDAVYQFIDDARRKKLKARANR